MTKPNSVGADVLGNLRFPADVLRLNLTPRSMGDEDSGYSRRTLVEIVNFGPSRVISSGR
jgi:hypothetical protein